MSNVKDVRIKTVAINLDKERFLKFDLNAFAELEDTYGNIDDAMKAMEKGSIKAVRALLWSGLIHEDPSLTQKDVGALIGLSDLQELSKSLTEAMGAQMPEPKAQKGPVAVKGKEETKN
jgi:hypothetical protein